jgi:hypothetical protein
MAPRSSRRGQVGKDKAKVEVAVQIAQRWILARLRNQRFHTTIADHMPAPIAAMAKDAAVPLAIR